jgi:cell division protein FtsB
MTVDENARQYIIELERLLLTKVDLLKADNEELRSENKMLRAQIQALQSSRKVDYQVAEAS